MPATKKKSGQSRGQKQASASETTDGESLRVEYLGNVNLKMLQNFRITLSDPSSFSRVDIAILEPSGRGRIFKAASNGGGFNKSFITKEEGKHEVSVAAYGPRGLAVIKNVSFQVSPPIPRRRTRENLIKPKSRPATRPTKHIKAPKLPAEFKGEDIKSWPNSSSYAQSFQNLKFSISPTYDNLRSGEAVKNDNVKYTTYIYGSGNFGTVFKLNSQGKDYAIKCFTRASPGLAERYYYIGYYISALKFPFLVDFQYLTKAVRLLKNPKQFYPVLKMEWITGTSLNEFITSNLKNKTAIRGVADSLLNIVDNLQSNGLAHGDLSGDNILVGKSGNVMLIDYDGMYVPAFKDKNAPEKGHDNFQHPGRKNHFSSRLDNFALLTIYTSLVALSSKPELWEYNGGDGDKLIFSASDFKNAGSSDLFSELYKMKGKTARLAKLLREACSKDPLWQGSSPAKIRALR